jgi:hypothetical protein
VWDSVDGTRVLPLINISSLTGTDFKFYILSAQRVDKIFRKMDKDKDGKLTCDEFVASSKEDPTIIKASLIYFDRLTRMHTYNWSA